MEENNQVNKAADEIIRQHIIEGLRSNPKIDALKIEVEVKNGAVILKGKTDTEKEKQLSENIARSVTGVTGVENHLHIDLGIVHALSSLAAHIQGDIIKDDEAGDEKK
jgi:hyperosmotically inducible periplasmic protein